MRSRIATIADAPAIAAIYNEGIEDRIATFETRLRTPAEIHKWFNGTHPAVVVEDDQAIIAFAATSEYRNRECYSRIAEFSVYVTRTARKRGAGKLAMETLMAAASKAGFSKLVSRIFVENHASRKLVVSCGFREVGVYQRHGKLDGTWHDVVIVEKLL